jgi:TRAP-type C4-dicarboxylate transport system substrate-binding protein
VEEDTVWSRRSFVAGLVGASISIWPRSARSQTLVARRYHPQPVDSHLHIYLTKLWDAVRTETGGQLNVIVYPQNNGTIIADPKILKRVQSGGLELLVLKRKHFEPGPAVDRHPGHSLRIYV